MSTLKHITSIRRLSLLAGVALAAAATLTPAYAGEKYPAPQQSAAKGDSQQLDTNQDGRISRAEAQRDPALRERFDVLDANRDGALDAAELGAKASPPASRGMEGK